MNKLLAAIVALAFAATAAAQTAAPATSQTTDDAKAKAKMSKDEEKTKMMKDDAKSKMTKDDMKAEPKKDAKAEPKKDAKADTKDAKGDAKTAAKKAEPMDINSASEKELATLPGIGEARAKAIVKGRPYKGKNELLDKNIVPQNAYKDIQDKIIAKQK